MFFTMNVLIYSKRPSIATALILTVFAFATQAASPSNYTQQARLASGVASDGYAGTGVAISGDTAVVASGSGYYVYTRSQNTWSQQTVLIPSDGLGGCAFRRTVAIDGNTIVAGCHLTNINGNTAQGAVYVFVRSGSSWTEVQRLLAGDGASTDRFGTSVAISGPNLIVGAPQKVINGGIHAGRAYVFVHNGSQWSEQGTLTATDPAAFNYFGNYVAIDNGNVAVGNNPSPGAGAPAAYVFVRSGSVWTQQQKISVCEPSGSSPQSCRFGSTVSIRGNSIAVGNQNLNVGTTQLQGGVYIFTRTGSVWTQLVRLTAFDGVAEDYFGGSVALGDSTLVVGAHADLGVPGKVYVYDWTGAEWVFQDKLIPESTHNFFGQQVAFDGNSIIAASPRDTGLPGEFVGAAYIYAQPAPTIRSPFDFDGDGKTDIGIFRVAVGEWWISRSSNGSVLAAQFGAMTDTIVPADHTGDGKSDIAVWRPSTGEWFVLRSEDFSFYAFPFGTTGDVPVPADYDADDKADAAVFRPSTATWYIKRSTDGGTTIQQFGASTDIPAVSDYDGDGQADIGIFRPGPGEWWINRSTGGLLALQFGNSLDKPVQGDYTGDGKSDVALWRPSTGEWFVLRSEDFSFYAFPFGTTGDIPAPGDYDGDGKHDATVFRPSSATWYSSLSTSGTLIQQFGATGDRPIPNAFVP